MVFGRLHCLLPPRRFATAAVIAACSFYFTGCQIPSQSAQIIQQGEHREEAARNVILAAGSDSDPLAGEQTGTGSTLGTSPQAYPIDLATALWLGDANNLTIALARERIVAGTAQLEGAEVLWLPNLSAGSTYMFHEGTIQRASGEILDQRRNSLFVGGGPTLSVDMADAIYQSLVARRLLDAETAAAAATQNEMLSKVAGAYFDMLMSHAGLEISKETSAHAAELARLTTEFTKEGVGLRSDAERARTESGTREQQEVLSQERVVVTSAGLAQLLRLDPQVQLVPLERNVVPIDLIADDRPLGELVAHALLHRPELAGEQSLVAASVELLRKATYAPLIPSVLLGYQVGGFGGGPNAFFGSFADRGDLTAAAIWELKNFGFGDRALRRYQQSQLSQAQMRALQMADRVAAEVVSSNQVVTSRRRQVELAQKTVEAALKSYELNIERIRGGAGLPIEVLQSLQALDRARGDYLQAVTAYNKAQFNLLTALGGTPVPPAETAAVPPEPLPAEPE